MADVYFLLDMSSSMKDSMALYKLLDFFSFHDKNLIVSIYFFNQHTDCIVDRCRNGLINIDRVVDEYTPCGSTSLYDAIDFVVTDAELHAKSKPKIIVYTDGVDTSSKYCVKSQIRDGINELRKLGWTFIFMGATIEAYYSARDIGIPRSHTIDARKMDCFQELYDYFKN